MRRPIDRRLPAALILAGLAFAGLLAAGPSASAQQPGCTPSGPSGPAVVFDCGAGFTITVERESSFVLSDADGDGGVDTMELNRGGALVDFDRPGTTFQILTPRAVASVRGTRWVVDAGAAATAVFVVRGAVAVRRRAGGEAVTLEAGEGVDVADGTAPLTVARWAAPRAAALLARFGQ